MIRQRPLDQAGRGGAYPTGDDRQLEPERPTGDDRQLEPGRGGAYPTGDDRQLEPERGAGPGDRPPAWVRGPQR